MWEGNEFKDFHRMHLTGFPLMFNSELSTTLSFRNWTSGAEHNIISSNVKDGTTVDVVFPLPPEWILSQGTVVADARFDVSCMRVYVHVSVNVGVYVYCSACSMYIYTHVYIH